VQIYNRAIQECQQIFALNADPESENCWSAFFEFVVGFRSAAKK
jgi:hypothetical protein